jgi:Tfp pilus assembly protein PilV
VSESWSNGETEKWSAESANTPSLLHSNAPRASARNDGRKKRSAAFALYEVLIGLTIFVIGVLALGRAVENCLNASTLSAEEDRVREILSNRMAEIQTAPGFPDVSKEFKVDTGYGSAKLIQKSVAAGLTEPDAGQLSGINLVTLTVRWERGGVTQSKQIEFYVYRSG